MSWITRPGKDQEHVNPYSLQSSAKGTPIALILFHALIFFPFRFTSSMEDRDSYRMLLGCSMLWREVHTSAALCCITANSRSATML